MPRPNGRKDWRRSAPTKPKYSSGSRRTGVFARRRFYAAQMNLAMQAWEAGQVARMLQLLESQRPRFDQDDLRGFDWYYLWRLCQGAYRYSLPTLNYDNASPVAISPDGKTLASGYGGTVRLWDVSTGRQSGELTGHGNMVGWLAFAPDGKTLASSDETETVRLWDLATGKARATVQPGQVVRGVQFTGDSQTLVLGGQGVKLWDVVANQEVATLGESDKGSSYVAVSPDGTVVAASGADEVRIWMRDGSEWHEAPPLTGVGWYPPVAISPDGKLLAIGYHGLRLFDLPSRQERPALQGHTGAVYAIAFAREGKHLVSGGQDRTVRRWDVATGKQQACIANPGPVYGLALTPDASVVGRHGHRRHPGVGRCSADTGHLFCVTRRPCMLWRSRQTERCSRPMGWTERNFGTRLDGREIITLATAPALKNTWWSFALAFLPDGRSLATSGTAEDTVDLWS